MEKLDSAGSEGKKLINDPELEAEMKKFVELSHIDGLTRLGKRNKLFGECVKIFDRFEKKESKEKNKTLSIVSIDIDFFKAYNNAVSHSFGDIALQTVAESLLKHNVENGGFSIRFGGEEISILIEEGLSEKEVGKVANQIKEEIKESLNGLFAQMDEMKGEKGACRQEMENNILTEGRNKTSFNDQMKAKFDERVGGMLELDLPADARKIFEDYAGSKEKDCAGLLLTIRDYSGEVTEFQREKLQVFYEGLRPEIGTVTVGAAHIEFDKESKINDSDKVEIEQWLMDVLEDEGEVKKYRKYLKKSYRNLYDELEKAAKKAHGDGDEGRARGLHDIVLMSQKKRVGKVVDLAIETGDDQKKVQRNSVNVISQSIIDSDRKKEGATEKGIFEEYRVLCVKLQKIIIERMKESRGENSYFANDLISQKIQAYADSLGEGTEEERSHLIEFVRLTQRDTYLDNLTGIENYEYLTKVVDLEVKEANKKDEEYSIVSFDLDNLKAFNETWGHKMGDIVLMKVSLAMQEGLAEISEKMPELYKKIEETGTQAKVMRATGGEEFILALPGLDKQQAGEVYEYLHGKAKDEIKEFMKQKPEPPYNEVKDEETGKVTVYDTYGERVEEYVLKLPLEDEKKGIKAQRTAEEGKKIGTLTAGVVSLKEIKGFIKRLEKKASGNDLLEGDIEIHAGELRALADMAGEYGKDVIEIVDDNNGGISGRGNLYDLQALSDEDQEEILGDARRKALQKAKEREQMDSLKKVEDEIARI